MRPFTENNPWPLLPAAATTLGLVPGRGGARGRDATRGVVSSPRMMWPRRGRSACVLPLGLATRLELPVLVAWCAGAAASAFAFGIIAKVVAGSVPESFADNLKRFGVHGSFVHQYVGVAFLFVATVIALLPAGQLGAAADEETSGRLVHVLAQPTSTSSVVRRSDRARASAASSSRASLAGLATWAGAKTQGVDLGAGTMVRAGLNVVPTALIVLGVGAVTLAIAPRVVTRVVYGVVAGSLIINVLSSTVTSLRSARSRLGLPLHGPGAGAGSRSRRRWSSPSWPRSVSASLALSCSIAATSVRPDAVASPAVDES